MAQLILNTTDDRIAPLIGKYQTPIASIVMDRDKFTKEQSIARKIFAERPSTHSVESYHQTTAVDSFRATTETGQYPTGGYEMGYSKELVNVDWKGSFGISQNARDDGTVDLTRLPNSFFSNYNRKFEAFFAQLLGCAITGTPTFTLDDMSFNTKCADGKGMFATDHPRKIKHGNQSNKYADEMSTDALIGITTEMQNVEDDNGNTMNIVPDTIIIPNDKNLKKKAMAIMGSSHEPGSANNDYNPLFEQYTLIIWPFLNKFITAGTAPYIVMSRQYNQEADGAVFQSRKDLTVRDEYLSNDVYQWNGHARFTGGFVDWRCMYLGGVDGGSTL